ncbi:MAG: haloacid dehalogenase type II [Actinomycetota bacterium]|nr:haloacid dehalogenase type II [Actinomycetota bacterium]
MAVPELVVLDVNETLSDLEPLRARFTDVGAPAHLLDTWFAGTLRDGFALAASGASRPFSDVGAAVLTGLLSHVDGLTVPVDEAVGGVLDGIKALDVHADVPDGLRAFSDAGVRVVTLTNGSLAQSEQLLERAGVADLVERRLSVDDAGWWKPHPDAYRYASEQCSVPLERCAMVAVHPWDLHGAAGVGMTTGWIDRRGTPWPVIFEQPSVTGATLTDVARDVVSLAGSPTLEQHLPARGRHA